MLEHSAEVPRFKAQRTPRYERTCPLDALERDRIDAEVGGASQGGRMHGLTKLAALLVGLVLLGHVRPALAASPLRCGARLVGEGQMIDDVYERCGEPTEPTVSTEFVTVRVSCDVAVTRAVPVEYWTYDRGPKQFVRYLTFRDGTLVAIDEGSYGNW
jgi:hypothetical protein